MPPVVALSAGIVGVGMIGAGVARSLHRSGRRATVADISAEAAAALTDIADVVPAPADVARTADVVHIAVVDYDQVLDVLEGERGILRGVADRAGAAPVIALLSTVSLEQFHDLRGRVATAGAELIDCPVARGDLADRNGMIAMAGGDTEPVERARPVIEAWARTLIHCGPAGSGMVIKIARNAITFGMWSLLEETSSLTRSAGASEEALFHTIRESDPSGELLFQWRQISGSLPPSGPGRDRELDRSRTILSKDLGAAAGLGRDHGVATPTLDAVRVSILRELGIG